MTSFFPVSHSILSCPALAELIQANYELTKIRNIIFYQAGLNDTYLLTTDTEKYILRVYRKNWRSLSDIQCEISLLQHLDQHHIPVACAIARKDNDYITSVMAPEGQRYMVLFQYIEGHTAKFNQQAETEAASFGHSMAKMHNAQENFYSQHPRFKLDLQHLLEQPMAIIETYTGQHPDHWHYLKQLATQLAEQVNQIPTDALSYGYCHGDLNGDNARLEQNKLKLFDFDCCGQGHLAYDLAVFRWGARLINKEQQLWPAFIAAYETERTLTTTDKSIIKPYTIIRHIWHMGLHLQLSREKGQHWVNDQYFDQQVQLLKDWNTNNI